MFNNLFASIEAELNQTAIAHQQDPANVLIAQRKTELSELAMNYVALENKFREISGQNSVY